MLPIALPVALSALQGLLRLRSRVDEILALERASEALPFALPPVPFDDVPHLAGMRAFFSMPDGAAVLRMRKQVDRFKRWSERPDHDDTQADRQDLCRLYYEASGVVPSPLGPAPAPSTDRPYSREERMAWFVVDSVRLSGNPAFARLLLATADTLLETAGPNAGLFLRNPHTRELVGTLIDEFAGKRDFDDASAPAILKSLLGSAVVAAAEHPGRDAGKPALRVLYAAVADVRRELGDDFVAGFVSRDGFTRLASAVLGRVAAEPALVTKHDVAAQVLSATLAEAATRLPEIVADPEAAFFVLEAAVAAGAENVAPLLERTLGDRPLVAAVLSKVLDRVEATASARTLFAGAADGTLFAGLYATALATVAEDPARLAAEAGLDPLVASLVAGAADALSRRDLVKAVSRDALRAVAEKSLGVLAAHAPLLARDSAFAAELLGDALAAAAVAVGDGVGEEDLVAVADAALRSAAENVALLGAEGTAGAVLAAAGAALAAPGLRAVLTADGRRAALLAALGAVAANPVVWKDLHAADLAQPVVLAVIEGLAKDGTKLLSGRPLVEATRLVLAAAARRGGKLVDGKVKPDALRALLDLTLAAAGKEIGRSIDGETLPFFLERVTLGFLKSPFAVTATGGEPFRKLVAATLKAMEA